MNRQLQNVQDIYPLSPMQQGMLFHSIFMRGTGTYVEQMRFGIAGLTSVSAFQQAWSRVIERNPILRTGFTGDALAEQVQVVHRSVRVPFESQDWRAVPETDHERRLQNLLTQERVSGFDVSAPPLMRLKLICMEGDRYEFIWTFHHVLLDGWSVPLLLQEVFGQYEALRMGHAMNPPLRRPYRDYILWLRRQDMSKAEAYWQKTLHGFTAPTPIAIRKSVVEHGAVNDECAVRERELPPDITANLHSLARSNDITLNTLVQGAWALLLAHYGGCEDVVFGATVSGRSPELAGAESMIGLFINTLPVRVNVRKHQRVREWLKGLQSEQVEMRQYEYSPLVTIHGWSDVPRGTPLFESIVVFENYPIKDSCSSRSTGLDIFRISSADHTNYPIALVANAGAELVLKIVFQTAQFQPQTIEMALGHLENVLRGFAANPDCRLRDISPLSDTERRALLQFSGPIADVPDYCVHEVIESVATVNPERTAVQFEDCSVSYGELNDSSNRLANHLRALGAGPETLVGILCERSLEMIVALLGVLKSGAAYVPFDPSYPGERLRFMVEDSGVQILLTQQRILENVPATTAQVIMLDADWPVISQQSSASPKTNVSPDNLAYVIYTSGSTGRPKGVMLCHRGLASLVADHKRILGDTAAPVLLQFASLSFDASVVEIFTTLSHGATLHVPCSGMEIDAGRQSPMDRVDELARILREAKITTAILPPSVLGLLPEEDFAELQTLITAGEACPSRLAQQWSKGRRFFNAYGPTETTVCATMGECNPDDSQPPSIGQAISNVCVNVLNENLDPTACMVPGEIYVAGIGVARGYLNRPELTSERFLPDPYSSEPGARMYKTGDLGRFRHDGSLEFLGRIDHQVKIRGFRVELGEIESALQDHPAIAAAVVVADEDEHENKRLVAHMVLSDRQTKPEASSLREYLKTRLPEYMVPSAFSFVDAVPRLPNGKVDRNALPRAIASGSSSPYVAPRDNVEAQLVQIWEDVLNHHPIGVKDDFFELGGHSLLAVRVAAQVRSRMGCDLALSELFGTPTIEAVAAALRTRQATPGLQTVMKLQGTPASSKRPIFFIHPSGGSAHWYTDLARFLGKDQPFYGIQARGLLGEAEVHTRVEDMAQFYVEALRSIQPEGPYAIGSWSMGVVVAFEISQQLLAAGQQVGFLALLDQGPFMPGAPPADQAEYLVSLFGKCIPISLEELRGLGPNEQVAHVLERAKSVEFIYPDISLWQFQHYVHLMQTHADAWRGYVPRKYAGPITLFRAQEQSPEAPTAPDLGWGEFADTVEVHEVPGNHLSMVHEPDVVALAEIMRACLDRFNQAYPLAKTVRAAG